MKFIVVTLVVALVLVLSTLSVQNPTPVNLRFLAVQSGDVPVYVIMLGSTVIGMLLIALLGVPGRLRSRFAARRLRHQLADAEQQIMELRARVPPVMKPLPAERGISGHPVSVPPPTGAHEASHRDIRPTHHDYSRR